MLLMQVFTLEKLMRNLIKYFEPAETPFFIFGNKNTYMNSGCASSGKSHHT